MKREPKWKRITALRALDLVRRLERARGIPQLREGNMGELYDAVDWTLDALDSHVRAELTRGRR